MIGSMYTQLNGADLNAVESTAARFITILHQRCLVTHYVTGRRSILTAEIMDPRISQNRFSSNRKIGEVSIRGISLSTYSSPTSLERTMIRFYTVQFVRLIN